MAILTFCLPDSPAGERKFAEWVFSSVARCFESWRPATEFVDSQLRTGMTFDGSPVCCHASTRRGTACARLPLPGSKYCPSHKHLDEELEVAAA